MNMKYRNMFHKYMAPAGSEGSQDGGGGNSEGDKPNESGDNSEDGGTSEKEAELLKEVMKKKGKITELSEQLAKFEGIDVEKYNELVKSEADAKKAQEEAEKEKLKAEGKVEELLALKDKENQAKIDQIISQHKNELKALQEQNSAHEASQAEHKALIEELTVGNAFGGSSVIRDELISAFTPERMRVLYGTHFDTENGKVVAYDKPRGAEGRVQLVDKENNPVTFDEAIKRLIESGGDSEAMYRNKARKGAGSFSSNSEAKTEPKVQSGIGRIEAALNKS